MGVSRTTGNNWARGYNTYRQGKAVGFVATLERLAVRQISARFLTQDERIEIADLHHAGVSIRQIAARLGRAPSTISRESRRNFNGGAYRPFEAHRHATARRARHHRRRIDTSLELRQLIGELLAQRWSPQQISRHLRRRFRDRPAMQLCHESIYQAVYQPGSARHCDARRSLPRGSVRRFAPAAIIGAHINGSSGAGQGSNSRCERSISGRFCPRTAPRLGIGGRHRAPRGAM